MTLPIGLPLMAGYVIIYAAMASPDAAWLRLVSLLPPFMPSVMPARIALGHIAWWEPPLAALIMAAAIYVVIRVSARVYADALISSGARLSWRGALRLRGER